MAREQCYITKPQELVEVGAEQWNFERFVRWLLDADHRFNSDAKGAKCAMRIERALEDCAKSVVLKLAKDDQAELAKAANEPHVMTNGGQVVGIYPSNPARKWLVFVRPIDDPKDSPPAVLADQADEAAE